MVPIKKYSQPNLKATIRCELYLIRDPVNRLHVVLESGKLRVALAADVAEVRSPEWPRRRRHGGREVDVEAFVHQTSEKKKFNT